LKKESIQRQQSATGREDGWEEGMEAGPVDAGLVDGPALVAFSSALEMQGRPTANSTTPHNTLWSIGALPGSPLSVISPKDRHNYLAGMGSGSVVPLVPFSASPS